ncbi:DNA polymerase delta subunit 2-like [Clytia hemisphaerica]
MKNTIREECAYKNLSERFIYTDKRKFNLQYSQLYAIRLMVMRPKLETAAKNKWGDDINIVKLSDITRGEECIIVGTIFRKMELQPSVLKEISSEERVLAVPPTTKLASNDDELILEGDQQRIALTGSFPLSTAVTGTIVALSGKEIEGGKFEVADHCFALIPIMSNPSPKIQQDKYVLFISGLEIGSKQGNLLNTQLLFDLIAGQLSMGEDTGRQICRVVIAGNTLSKDTQDKESEKVAKYLTKHVQAKTVDAIKTLDELLTQLGSCVPVDVMPGEYDPTNQFLPQQPLHKCMLPSAFSYSTVQSVTNPYDIEIDGRRILGTSGQNVTNIYQFAGMEKRLHIMESNLNAAHISPTSPDTLSCYPYFEKDPFVLEDCPHIYFAGNQPRLESKTIKDDGDNPILLLCIPSFATTQSCVLVNLKDLSCHPLYVDADMFNENYEETSDLNGEAKNSGEEDEKMEE